MVERFSLPKSIEAYLLDPAVRTGVDSLLSIKADGLPNGLKWSELPDYYGAYAVAQLTKAEWPKALFDIWSAVWGCRLPACWVPVEIEQQLESKMLLTPQGCWEGKGFLAEHQKGDLWLFTGLEVRPDRLQIAFSLERLPENQSDGEPLISEAGNEYVWQDDEQWSGWNVATFSGCVADPGFDLESVMAAATHALSVVEKCVHSLA